MRTVFQAGVHYGGVDSRFPGITISLAGNLENLEALSSQWDRQHARPRDPVLGTVLSHEMRHLHDLLLSPMGSAAMRLRMNAAWAGTYALLMSASLDYNTIPVPVSRWMTWDIETRERYLSRVQRLMHSSGQPLPTIPDLPVITHQVPESQNSIDPRMGRPAQVLPEYLVGISRNYRSIDLLLNGFTGEGAQCVHASMLFESSALVVQAQEILENYGEEHLPTFLTAILENEKYGHGMRSLLSAMAEKSSSFSLRSLAAVFSYSLLGSVEPDVNYGQSLVRFGAVLQYIREHGLEISNNPSADEIKALFGDWDRYLERNTVLVAPTLEGLAASLDWERTVADTFPERARLQPPSEAADSIARVFLQSLTERRELVQQFLESPELFVFPGPYLAHSRASRPPVVQLLTDGIFPHELVRSRLSALGWTPLVSLGENEDRLVALPPGADTSSLSGYEPKDLAWTMLMSAVTDELFMDAPQTDTLGREYAPEVLKRLTGRSVGILRVVGPFPSHPPSMSIARTSFGVSEESVDQDLAQLLARLTEPLTFSSSDLGTAIDRLRRAAPTPRVQLMLARLLLYRFELERDVSDYHSATNVLDRSSEDLETLNDELKGTFFALFGQSMLQNPHQANERDGAVTERVIVTLEMAMQMLGSVATQMGASNNLAGALLARGRKTDIARARSLLEAQIEAAGTPESLALRNLALAYLVDFAHSGDESLFDRSTTLAIQASESATTTQQWLAAIALLSESYRLRWQLSNDHKDLAKAESYAALLETGMSHTSHRDDL